ncbi:alpha/beta fold hydrolase [Aurantimonas endophytica]|uniref:Pimeloyl-ACP methyl ester carboxylesterase n=1 Tax=Aurantimonas endophytica TaxID=1522175 RepID=A0A7W6HH50_9HYPH|nr:pimeloyl-ACP methyl ester carboxylesterase [Aurantimonas endophytica]MCO6406214.1 alpha/beta fold hydrolase [Aurantimonas endophytica]
MTLQETLATRSVVAGDLTVAYLEAGPVSALPVLCLHGAVQTKSVWRPQIAGLASDYRLLAPDLRGHGETLGDTTAMSVESLAVDAFGFLDALGIERAALCGVSLGGMVALEMAAHRPARVAAMVLADTPLALSLHGPLRAALEWLGPQRILPAAFALLGQHRTARWGIAGAKRIFGEEWVGADAERHFVEGFSTMPADAVVAAYAAIVAADPAAIRALDIACLVIIGRHETQLVIDHAGEIARRIGRAEIVTVEAGHVSNLDAPEAFNAAVASFLAESS